MSQFLLLLVIALVVGGIIFGVIALITGSDPGMVDVDGQIRAVPLPVDRGLDQADLTQLRFDTGLRGYRSDQVDSAIDRVGNDMARKGELIALLESEVTALRDGRIVEANQFKESREQLVMAEPEPEPEPVEADAVAEAEAEEVSDPVSKVEK